MEGLDSIWKEALNRVAKQKRQQYIRKDHGISIPKDPSGGTSGQVEKSMDRAGGACRNAPDGKHVFMFGSQRCLRCGEAGR